MESVDLRSYWELIHEENHARQVSWFQDVPRMSLKMIETAGLPKDARILEVGCGQRGVPGALVENGYTNVVATDLSAEALARAQEEIGPAAAKVAWLQADALDMVFDEPFDLWHDRAVLHFFVDDVDRARYVAALGRGLRPGGHAVIATFAPDGPERCSGLPVRRQSAADIAALLGPGFELVADEREEHRTPWGKTQMFQWTLFRRKNSEAAE